MLYCGFHPEDVFFHIQNGVGGSELDRGFAFWEPEVYRDGGVVVDCPGSLNKRGSLLDVNKAWELLEVIDLHLRRRLITPINLIPNVKIQSFEAASDRVFILDEPAFKDFFKALFSASN